jgi:hypothetical protein
VFDSSRRLPDFNDQILAVPVDEVQDRLPASEKTMDGVI